MDIYNDDKDKYDGFLIIRQTLKIPLTQIWENFQNETDSKIIFFLFDNDNNSSP